MTHCGGHTRPLESHYAVVLNMLAVNERKSDDIFKVITNPKPKKTRPVNTRVRTNSMSTRQCNLQPKISFRH